MIGTSSTANTEMVKEVAGGKVTAEAQANAGHSEAGAPAVDDKDAPPPTPSPRPPVGLVTWARRIRRALWPTEEALITQYPAGTLEVHGQTQRKPRGSFVAQFFTSGFAGEESTSGNDTMSPVMIQNARLAQAERKRPKGKALNKTGGLRRLLRDENKTSELTPDEEVGDYLRRQGVATSQVSVGQLRDDSQCLCL